VPGEQELERGDVPAAAAGDERAAAERVRAEVAERGARTGRERGGGARKLVHGGERLRPDPAVDVAAVQSEAGQPRLQRRDVGAAGAGGLRGHGEGESCEERCGESRAHALCIGRGGIPL